MSNTLIDGDILKYRIASATDGKRHKYRGEEYESIKEMKMIYGSSFIRSAVETTYTPEPWGKVKKSLDRMIEDVMDEHPFADIYIGAKANFRYKVATILPYKGNRKDAHRPHHLEAVAQYMVDSWGAKLPEGPWETDDQIAMDAREGDTILTLDKDYLQIPNIKLKDIIDGSVIKTSEVSSLRCLYQQVLTGDSVDAIPGLYMVGAKNKAVKDLATMETEEEMFDHVLKQYTVRFHSYAEQFMAENLMLLYLLREDGKELNWIDKLNKGGFYNEL